MIHEIVENLMVVALMNYDSEKRISLISHQQALHLSFVMAPSVPQDLIVPAQSLQCHDFELLLQRPAPPNSVIIKCNPFRGILSPFLGLDPKTSTLRSCHALFSF